MPNTQRGKKWHARFDLIVMGTCCSLRGMWVCIWDTGQKKICPIRARHCAGKSLFSGKLKKICHPSVMSPKDCARILAYCRSFPGVCQAHKEPG